MINNTQIPNKDNTGRAFPFNDDATHYVGPAVVNGVVYRMSVWLNQAPNGRSYVRATFEEYHLELEEEQWSNSK